MLGDHDALGVADGVLGHDRHAAAQQFTGGAFLEIDEQQGPRAHELDGPWHPAGHDWQRARRTERVRGIVAAELQCDEPAKVAARWSEIIELPLPFVLDMYEASVDDIVFDFPEGHPAAALAPTQPLDIGSVLWADVTFTYSMGRQIHDYLNE